MTPSSPNPDAAGVRRGWLAWGLLAYGVLGVLLVIVGGIVGIGLADRLDRTLTAIDGTLAAAADSTRAVSESFDSVDRGLTQAEVATDGAAALALETSQTLAQLADAMDISIFGAQPLAPLAEDFSRVAGQAEEVGGALAEIGGSLAEVRTDAATIAVELSGLADELDALRTETQEASSTSMIPFVILLMAWISVPAVGALISGWWLLRDGRLPIA